jgi:hypothetical protein
MLVQPTLDVSVHAQKITQVAQYVSAELVLVVILLGSVLFLHNHLILH